MSCPPATYAPASNKPKMMLRKNNKADAADGSTEDGKEEGVAGDDNVIKSFGNTVFQKNILTSKWDQKEFAQAIKHAQAVMREGKAMLDCLESIEASNEDEDEDYDMYEDPRTLRASVPTKKHTAPIGSGTAAKGGSGNASGMFGGGMFSKEFTLPGSLRSRMFGGNKGGVSSVRSLAEPTVTPVSGGLNFKLGGSTNAAEPISSSAEGDVLGNNLNTTTSSRAFGEPLQQSAPLSPTPPKGEPMQRLLQKAEPSQSPPQLPKLPSRGSFGGGAIDPLGGGTSGFSPSTRRVSSLGVPSAAGADSADEEEGRAGFGTLSPLGGASLRQSSRGRSSYT